MSLPLAESLSLPGAELRYCASYVQDPNHLLNQLAQTVMWEQPRVNVFGRWHLTPRLVSFVGDAGLSYRYSGQRHMAQAWPDVLIPLKQQLQHDVGVRFNSALLNYYRSGDDCMGWHSDDESELGSAPTIASISVGAARDFRIRPFPGRAFCDQAARTLSLENGSLLLMLPPTQQFWQHSLPRRARRGPRINLTFRHIIY